MDARVRRGRLCDLRRVVVRNALAPPALRSLDSEADRGLATWITLHDAPSEEDGATAAAVWRSPVAKHSVNAAWAVEEAELPRTSTSGAPFAWADAFVVRLWSRSAGRDVEITSWTVALDEMVALPQRAFQPYFSRMPAYTLLLDMQDDSDGWGRLGREQCRLYCFPALVEALTTQAIIPQPQQRKAEDPTRSRVESAEEGPSTLVDVARGLASAVDTQCALHAEHAEIDALRVRIADALRRREARSAAARRRSAARQAAAALRAQRDAEATALAQHEEAAAALEAHIDALRVQTAAHAGRMQTLLSAQYDAHTRDRDERVAKLGRVRHAMRARQLKLVAGVQKLYPIREVEGRVFELMSRGLPSTECVVLSSSTKQ